MQHYCTKYGFTPEKIAARLALAGLGAADHGLAVRLRDEVIAPNLDTIVDRFYAELGKHEAARDILTTDDLVSRLRATQCEYLLSLGIGFDTDDYFEERLRVGLVHAWIGLPLTLYQCAFRVLVQSIIDSFSPVLRNDVVTSGALTVYLLKIATLDMSLAVETYHASHVDTLETNLAKMYNREVQLRREATIDSLTGLLDHAHVLSHLQQALSDAASTGQPLAVVMADIDYFKRINDTHGHPAGDEVLREVAARLTRAVRAPDLIGRYGGEEFLLVLAGTDLDAARNIVERARVRLADHPVTVEGVAIPVTMSIGFTMAQPADTAHTIVKRADLALYAAKHAGRNCVIAG